MTRARKTNLFFLWMLVFYIAGCLFVIPVLPDSCFKNYSNIVIGQSLIFIPFVLYLIVTKGKTLKDLKVRRIGVLNTFLLVILTYCMIPVVSFLNVLTMMFAKNEVSGQLDGMSNNNFLFNIFITAFVPAIMEELIFRGVLYSGYRNSTIKRAILGKCLGIRTVSYERKSVLLRILYGNCICTCKRSDRQYAFKYDNAFPRKCK